MDQSQKTPLARSLEQFANRKVRGALDLLGQSLPASVVAVVGSGIVTVKFELTNVPFTLPQITVPIIGSEYVRLPIQPGMKGFVIAADAYLGGMTGLGGGTADLSPRPNLSNLAFIPLGNKGWTPTDDPNALVLYGPDGVIIRNVDKTKVIDLTAATGIVITIPAGQAVTINGNVIVNGNMQLGGALQGLDGNTYAGDIKTGGEVYAKFGTPGQVGTSTHQHTQPNDSHGDAEGPTNPPTGGT